MWNKPVFDKLYLILPFYSNKSRTFRQGIKSRGKDWLMPIHPHSKLWGILGRCGIKTIHSDMMSEWLYVFVYENLFLLETRWRSGNHSGQTSDCAFQFRGNGIVGAIGAGVVVAVGAGISRN